MNNITSWMQQAKEVTKKISEMMYIPPEDNIEQEETLDDVISEKIPMENQKKVPRLKEMKNKENISSDNGLTMEHDENAGSKQRFGGLNRSKLENDAAATVEAARKYANSFFSLAKEATAKAALTAEETAKKLQNVVTEKTIIGKLDKEQAKFKNEVNASNLTACILPWSDLPDQWIAKKHILSLSLDTRNFTRDPPSETNFDFICVQSVAAALLEEDPNLRKIRFQLVPKKLNEERFWRNYFYRISLVRQAALGESSLSVAEVPVFSRAIEKEESLKSCDPKDNVQEQKVEENEDKVSKISMKEQNDIENVDSEAKKKSDETHENTANTTQEKIREDFERDLINSFNDYELVSDETDKTDEQWEEEITELLNSA
ncbi:Synapse-associated protein [Dirofilaria immitis]